MLKKTKNNGFTLIELLITISIVLILGASVLPVLSKAREISKRQVCLSNLKQIGIAFLLYVQDYDDYFPCAQDPVNTNPTYWLWMGRGWRKFVSAYIGVSNPMITSKILTCPSDKTAPNKWESTSYAYSMCFYHSPEQINLMNSPAFTYSTGYIVPSIGQKANKVLHPSKKILAGDWLDNHTGGEYNWWSWNGARNYLFVDGHAEYIDVKKLLPANDGYPDPNLTVNGIQGKDID